MENYYYQVTIKKLFKLVAYCFLAVFPCALQAQLHDGGEKIEDPLAKPMVWTKLKLAPSDSVLWAHYYSKPLVCLSSEERNQWKALQDQLLSALGEVVIEGVSDHVDWEADFGEAVNEESNIDVSREQEAIALETENYLNRLAETLTAETQMITELKSDLLMNFFIIDEIYSDEFRQLGVEYESYLALHPKGEYDKEKWISEKEKELHKLKKKRFHELEKQIRRNARKHHQLSRTP